MHAVNFHVLLVLVSTLYPKCLLLTCQIYTLALCLHAKRFGCIGHASLGVRLLRQKSVSHSTSCGSRHFQQFCSASPDLSRLCMHSAMNCRLDCMHSPTCLAQVFWAHCAVPLRILALVMLPVQALTASRGTWHRIGPSSFPSLGGLHAHRVASAHELFIVCQRALRKWMSLALCIRHTLVVDVAAVARQMYPPCNCVEIIDL